MNRAQASIEFLLILSAISLISLSLIILYSNDLSLQKQALLDVNTVTTPANLPVSNSAINSPKLLSYVPLNITIGSDGRMELLVYGCAQGNVKASISSNSLLFASDQVDSNFSNVYIQDLVFSPITLGKDFANLNYTVQCGNENATGDDLLDTYATGQEIQYQNATITGYITKRNESLIYPLSSPSSILSLAQSSRCTQLGPLGNPYDMATQCGTSDAWDYNVFSLDCYADDVSQTATYCVIPSPTGYNTIGMNTAAEMYSYSFQLQISTPYGLFLSNISSLDNLSNVMLNGKVIGTAKVISASVSVQPPEQVLMADKGEYQVANQSVYTAYIQAKNNLDSVLAYYNQSGVSGDIQSTIQEAISSYNESYSNLLASGPLNITGCEVSSDTYECSSQYPLSYIMSVKLNGYTAIHNQTVTVSDSVLNINET